MNHTRDSERLMAVPIVEHASEDDLEEENSSLFAFKDKGPNWNKPFWTRDPTQVPNNSANPSVHSSTRGPVPSCPSLCSKTTFSESQDCQHSVPLYQALQVPYCADLTKSSLIPTTATLKSSAKDSDCFSNDGITSVKAREEDPEAVLIRQVGHCLEYVDDSRNHSRRPLESSEMRSKFDHPNPPQSPATTRLHPDIKLEEIDVPESYTYVIRSSNKSNPDEEASEANHEDSDYSLRTPDTMMSRQGSPDESLPPDTSTRVSHGNILEGSMPSQVRILRSLAWILGGSKPNRIPISLAGTGGSDASSGDSSIHGGLGHSGSSSGTGSQETGSKRASASNGNDGFDGNHDRSQKRPRRTDWAAELQALTRPMRYACPFQKHDWASSPRCALPSGKNREGGFENFHRVKSHILHHDQARRCKRCWKFFETEEKAAQHSLEALCSVDSIDNAWMTAEQKRSFMQSRFEGNNEQKWYQLFEVLFPDELDINRILGRPLLKPYYELPFSQASQYHSVSSATTAQDVRQRPMQSFPSIEDDRRSNVPMLNSELNADSGLSFGDQLAMMRLGMASELGHSALPVLPVPLDPAVNLDAQVPGSLGPSFDDNTNYPNSSLEEHIHLSAVSANPGLFRQTTYCDSSAMELKLNNQQLRAELDHVRRQCSNARVLVDQLSELQENMILMAVPSPQEHDKITRNLGSAIRNLRTALGAG